jgi:hypothetical protein
MGGGVGGWGGGVGGWGGIDIIFIPVAVKDTPIKQFLKLNYLGSIIIIIGSIIIIIGSIIIIIGSIIIIIGSIITEDQEKNNNKLLEQAGT